MATKKTTTKRATKKAVPKKVENEVLKTGDVIDANEITEVEKNDTVTVCSNFPRDIVFVVKDNMGKPCEILIKGNSNNLRGKASGVLPIGAYGITMNVPAEAWKQIAEERKDDPRIKQGLIFATTANKARGEAKERKDLRNGFEPIEQKESKVKPNEE